MGGSGGGGGGRAVGWVGERSGTRVGDESSWDVALLRSHYSGCVIDRVWGLRLMMALQNDQTDHIPYEQMLIIKPSTYREHPK